jgi:hypothetical protein
LSLIERWLAATRFAKDMMAAANLHSETEPLQQRAKFGETDVGVCFAAHDPFQQLFLPVHRVEFCDSAFAVKNKAESYQARFFVEFFHDELKLDSPCRPNRFTF